MPVSAAQRAMNLINKVNDPKTKQRPPRHQATPSIPAITDGFDKKSWIIEHKQFKKEYILEDRERFRPLLRIKKDAEIRDFVEEIEKLEKRNEIGLMREKETIS